LIRKVAKAHDADESEPLLLAEKISKRSRQRVFERPDMIGALADCDGKPLGPLMGHLGVTRKDRKRQRQPQ
jgi:hypothetical protein